MTLYSAQFEKFHGRPMGFFLDGGQKITIGTESHYFDTPEEHDDWVKGAFGPAMAARLTGAKSRYEDSMAAPVDSREAIKLFREDPLETVVGNPLEVAKRITALDQELRTNSQPNPITLYRGAERPPHVDARNNLPISYSESRHAAAHFARANRGEVFKAGHETVRGLRMIDYGVTPKRVGPNSISEKEWLIDPRSVSRS